MDSRTISLPQALLLINDHVGERVRLALQVRDSEDPLLELDLLEIDGELTRLNTVQAVATMDQQERDESAAAYMIGAHLVDLGPAPGVIALDPDSVEFRLADGVTLAVYWLG